jgi:hypothetical protein
MFQTQRVRAQATALDPASTFCSLPSFGMTTAKYEQLQHDDSSSDNSPLLENSRSPWLARPESPSARGGWALLSLVQSNPARSLVCTLTAFFILVSALSYSHHGPPLPHFGHSALPSRRHDALTRGRWKPPSRVWAKEDVEKEWGRPPGGSPGNGGVARVLQVASWEWSPELRDGMRSWDAFDFVKRMFNSDVGLILVGGKSYRGALRQRRELMARLCRLGIAPVRRISQQSPPRLPLLQPHQHGLLVLVARNWRAEAPRSDVPQE